MAKKQIPDEISADQLFQAIMDNAPLLISAKDLKGNVIMANQRFELLEGYDSQNFVGRSVFDLFPPDVAEKLWQNDLAALDKDHQVAVEESVKHKDGILHTYQTAKFPLRNRHGEVSAICAISYDITDVKEAERRSFEDDLTELYNRRFFNKTFEEELKRARRSKSFLGLMLLDLDRFKNYNDCFGHEKGDDALKLVGKTLKKACHRASDFCFRIGGEEFAVLCTVDNEENVYELAAKIRDGIESLQLRHEQNPPHNVMTCSIGTACCQPCLHEATQSQLYSLADKGLYEAKDAGRNTIIAKIFTGPA